LNSEEDYVIICKGKRLTYFGGIVMDFIEKSLKKSILFNKLTDEEIKIIAKKIEKTLFKKGKAIVVEGEMSDCIFILLRGNARVSTRLEQYEIFLSELEPSAIIGEITLVDNKPISADVMATEACLVGKITHKALESIMVQNPAIAVKIWEGIARILSLRIRKSNEMMRNYFGINKAICNNSEFREFFSFCYYSPRE
jgi:CRP/FNR family cyclic AMP-dependent transcriptional regulator